MLHTHRGGVQGEGLYIYARPETFLSVGNKVAHAQGAEREPRAAARQLDKLKFFNQQTFRLI